MSTFAAFDRADDFSCAPVEVAESGPSLAAERLADAGVPAELRIWPGQIHVFHIAAPLVPEATRSLRQIGRYIRAAAG